jgi:hypothetical protein
MGSAARRRIVERYSMHMLVENTSRVYEAVLDRGSSATTEQDIPLLRTNT